MSNKPRRWFQVHLSTALLATLAAGAILGLNFWPVRTRCETIVDFFDDVATYQQVSGEAYSGPTKEMREKIGKAWLLNSDADLRGRDLSLDMHLYFSRFQSGWPWRALALGGAFDGPQKIEIGSDSNGVGKESTILAKQDGNFIHVDVTDSYDYDNVTASVSYLGTFNLKHGVRIANWQHLAANAYVGLLIVVSIIVATEAIIRRRERTQP